MKKKKSIKDIIFYSEIKKGQLVGGILFVSLGMLLSICPILVIYKVIKSLFLYGKLEQSAIQFCSYGLAAVVLAYCLTYIGSILCHKFSYVLIANLKKKILFHIGNLPLGFFTGDNKSKIRQVLGSDMNQIEGYFSHQLPNLISTLTLILAMIIVMLKINLILGLTTLLIIFVGLGIQIAIMARIIKSGGLEKNFAILDQINSATTEYVKGMPEVKIFGTGTKSFKTFSKSVGEYRDFTSSMTSMIRPGFVSFRMFILSVATFIVPVGILLMSRNNNLDFATVFIFYLILAPAISVPALKLRDFAEGMNLLNEVVLRVYEIIDQKELAIENTEEAIKGHDLEFNNVSFSYGNEEVLKNISFCAKQGEVTALVGYSGAGKSTIGTLIPRFYDPSEGSIKIGGVNIKNIPINALMDKIAFVFQDSDLITDTVFNNVAMAKTGSTKEDVIKACKKARCHDFIVKLPDGYDTVLGKGTYLSGGEKQRIAVARAILKDAPILVLDEATSFADSENEYLMQEALSELVKDKTVIMIAHRLNTIEYANQILVISDGKIAERGKHEDLILANGIYKRLFDIYKKTNIWQMDIEGSENK
ncbi:Iron import ATP-binding/permease protein IrtA [Peptostreptococcus anaerobius]|jgi:ATP-binding cassette subfamily B protein|uniref:Iron import ATP-binding/permease protein IrtA n=3 Tax=Peptostreptococcus anaerobius TaxID=1261 RepID=A0A379CHF8_9FIRM|nr:ABC transporter ATP-binding protein [Peptostreptococcus anaerobius]EKX94206.1 ABC transporter, ATP-binding protein [Peptostreptococcus anaerobius VPI 4330 = DSM 2949]SFM62740.1 ATP-binding cassette, subfamily B [Peptostreptococcus anaerobius]SUB61499.1 Iron import ATP-binding/permease protein IrtA [Peptostreptococcus anaerobius]